MVLRIPGTDPDAADRALLLHGHLDVVAAQASDWTHPPFAAEIATDPDSGLDMVWGRGAVDMKDMVAMILAVARHWGRDGDPTPPRRRAAAPARRGGRRASTARTGWSRTGRTSSRA